MPDGPRGIARPARLHEPRGVRTRCMDPPLARGGSISLDGVAGLDVIHGPRRAEAGTYIRPGTPPVVEISGEIDIQCAPRLQEELLRLIRRRGPQLPLDLAGVTFLDCAGINALLAPITTPPSSKTDGNGSSGPRQVRGRRSSFSALAGGARRLRAGRGAVCRSGHWPCSKTRSWAPMTRWACLAPTPGDYKRCPSRSRAPRGGCLAQERVVRRAAEAPATTRVYHRGTG